MLDETKHCIVVSLAMDWRRPAKVTSFLFIQQVTTAESVFEDFDSQIANFGWRAGTDCWEVSKSCNKLPGNDVHRTLICTTVPLIQFRIWWTCNYKKAFRLANRTAWSSHHAVRQPYWTSREIDYWPRDAVPHWGCNSSARSMATSQPSWPGEVLQMTHWHWGQTLKARDSAIGTFTDPTLKNLPRRSWLWILEKSHKCFIFTRDIGLHSLRCFSPDMKTLIAKQMNVSTCHSWILPALGPIAPTIASLMKHPCLQIYNSNYEQGSKSDCQFADSMQVATGNLWLHNFTNDPPSH